MKKKYISLLLQLLPFLILIIGFGCSGQKNKVLFSIDTLCISRGKKLIETIDYGRDNLIPCKKFVFENDSLGGSGEIVVLPDASPEFIAEQIRVEIEEQRKSRLEQKNRDEEEEKRIREVNDALEK